MPRPQSREEYEELLRFQCPLILEGLDAYLQRGLPPGDFLLYVLENDLAGASIRADSGNYHNLAMIAEYIHYYFPHECHGSKNKVRNWLNHFKGGIYADKR